MIISIFKYIYQNFGVSSTYGLDLRACRTKCRISDKVGQNVGFFFIVVIIAPFYIGMPKIMFLSVLEAEI